MNCDILWFNRINHDLRSLFVMGVIMPLLCILAQFVVEHKIP